MSRCSSGFCRRRSPRLPVDELCRKHNVKVGRGIYSLAVVVWLMLYQRLNSKRTLSSAVHFLARQAIHWQQGRPVGKRIREGRISTRTGGYCQARLKMPTLVASSVADHIFEQLQALMREPLSDVSRPMFVVDGTTLQLAHERELVKAFPPGRNQHGDNHWPTMLLVTFHDVHTGLATRPSWGRCTASEPSASRNWPERRSRDCPPMRSFWRMETFGIFWFAYEVQQTRRQMLLRLTVSRAQKVLGGNNLRPGRRRKTEWAPSAWERKVHLGCLMERW